MRIELTGKTIVEVAEIQKMYPDGHLETIDSKAFWVFENKVDYGV